MFIKILDFNLFFKNSPEFDSLRKQIGNVRKRINDIQNIFQPLEEYWKQFEALKQEFPEEDYEIKLLECYEKGNIKFQIPLQIFHRKN